MKKELIAIVKQLRCEQNVQDEWLNSLPNDLHSAFFDNAYVNSICIQRDVLIEAAFGNCKEDVFWFLYEFNICKTTGPHIITQDGTEYTFNTDEDFYKYLEVIEC